MQVPMFRDPKEYEHMSQEEREELTRQMMSAHKGMANASALSGNKKNGHR